VLEASASAFARWQEVYSGESLPEPEAAEVLKELLAAAKRVELASRQAKLLAEAALAPCGGLFEELGLSVKPRRRPPRAKEQAAARADEDPAAPQADAEAAPQRQTQPDPEPVKSKRKKGGT
jgi:hypothetical protein